MTRPSDWTDEQLLTAMRDDLRLETPIEFVLRPHTALALAGMVQLALRHPEVGAMGDARMLAVTFIEHVRAYFRDHGAVASLEAMRRGYVTEQTITCPRCGMTSFNKHDIEHQYCGACHAFIEGL